MAEISHRGQCCNRCARSRVNKELRLHFRCDEDNKECRPNRCDKASRFSFFFLFSSFRMKVGTLIDKVRFFFVSFFFSPKTCLDKALWNVKLERKNLISFRLDVTHTWTGARGAAVWLKCTCAQLVRFFFWSCPCRPPTPPNKVWMGRFFCAAGPIKRCFFSHNSQIILSLRPFLRDTLSHNLYLTETWLAAYPGTWLAQSKLVNVQQCRTSSERKINVQGPEKTNNEAV